MTTAPTETVLVSTLEAELLSSFLVSVPPPQAHSANTMTRASASATILLNFIVVSLLFEIFLLKRFNMRSLYLSQVQISSQK